MPHCLSKAVAAIGRKDALRGLSLLANHQRIVFQTWLRHKTKRALRPPPHSQHGSLNVPSAVARSVLQAKRAEHNHPPVER